MENNLNINKQLNDFAVYLKHSKSIIRQLKTHIHLILDSRMTLGIKYEDHLTHIVFFWVMLSAS